MKVGDLVRVKDGYGPKHQLYWVGVIVSFDSKGPIVYWNRSYPKVEESIHNVELAYESR